MSKVVIPILPLRDVVVYPHMVIPLFVGREKSIKALEAAIEGPKQILLVAQKEANKDSPESKDIYEIGTLSNLLQLLKLPDGTVKVLVEGVDRAKITHYEQSEPYFAGTLEIIQTKYTEGLELEASLRSLLSIFEQYAKLDKKVSSEIIISLSGIENPIRLVDTIVAHMPLKISDKQNILEIIDLKERIEKLIQLIGLENDLLQIERKLTGDVKRQIEKSQKEYYLNEKMKAIQKELGEMFEEGGNKYSDMNLLMEKIEKAGLSKEAKDKVMAEVNKLKMMPPMAAEATVSRNYIDVILSLPWIKKSKIRKDLAKAETILNAKHWGLEKVKERILEYLAVHQRVPKMHGGILCFVGPPGVGKTSLGESMAEAQNREFVRFSVGGVRDEAEIRGHRRTYIGALPGKILQKLAKVGVNNPLFMLDEIDKMSSDFRGDPASALLEVLDPEQNHTFNDHYLEVDYDLSQVMFVATANSTNNIPPALLDRMEIIRLAGYTEEEKLNIAKRYLLPKLMEQNGLKPAEFDMTEDAIRHIVRYYTREAGVRNLEREMSKICRKVVKGILLGKIKKKTVVRPNTIESYLGVIKFRYGQIEVHDQIGRVTGLAWTEVGGDTLTVEAAAVPGKGKVTSTGKLGEVMQESIQAAVTVVRSRAQSLGIPVDFYEKHDLHIHVPEGATPKDGPSAGIGVCTALVSILTNTPVRRDVAMTGEITLRGQILPIGGLKEKLLAAKRAGILNVIIPEENMKELKEIPDDVYAGIKILPVQWIDQVFEYAFLELPGTQTIRKGGVTGKLKGMKGIKTIKVPKPKSGDHINLPH